MHSPIDRNRLLTLSSRLRALRIQQDALGTLYHFELADYPQVFIR